MSQRHPIIAITGSSGAGTSTVKGTLDTIFQHVGAQAAFVAGDSFHRYDRSEMKKQRKKAKKNGKRLSHFGPEGNLFDKQLELFQSYGKYGTGQRRQYIHDDEEAAIYACDPGTFSQWETIPNGTDLLFYEGLHGGVETDQYNLADEVDLLIGVAPSINLEWIQKINRDTKERGYDHDDVCDAIYRRMYDYMNYILPQFSNTHINFQRVPIIDTSNPFMVRQIPTADQSLVVIHFLKFQPSVEYKLHLKGLIEGLQITTYSTVVIPGGKMQFAMELILTKLIIDLMEKRAHMNDKIL